jgi:dimethylsulfone monooxygenase
MTITSDLTPADQHREGRPLLSDQNFKLALFAMNIAGGMVASTAEGVLVPTWENQLRLARTADQAGFEAIITAARWKGYGGPSDWNGTSLEPLTWTSAVASVTEYSNLIGTIHVNSLHPVLAAKQSTTVDQISGGRFGFNIVAGWNPNELELFGGGKMLDHEGRYSQAAEWLDFVKKLWTADEEFDFDGDFYAAKGAISRPHPVQKPHPLIINAAGSDRGLQFVAAQADVCFTSAGTIEELEQKVPTLRQKIRDQSGREIKVLTCLTVVCRDTEAEAKRWWDYVVKEKGDREAAAHWAGLFSKESKTYSEEKYRELQAKLDGVIAGLGTLQVAGTPEQIAETIGRLSEIGLDGTTISFMTDWEGELERFVRDVMPLLEQAGLREPFVNAPKVSVE